eukprot:SAG11_NODE_86_length_17300_cov_11.466717_22_plen_90_part_00
MLIVALPLNKQHTNFNSTVPLSLFKCTFPLMPTLHCQAFFLMTIATPSDDRNLSLLPLLLELLEAPEQLPEFALRARPLTPQPALLWSP